MRRLSWLPTGLALGVVVALISGGLMARSQAPIPDGAFVRGQDGSTWVVDGGMKRAIVWLDDSDDLLAGMAEGAPIASVLDYGVTPTPTPPPPPPAEPPTPEPAPPPPPPPTPSPTPAPTAAPTPAPTPAPPVVAPPPPPPPMAAPACCRVCTTGKPCGDSCIARNLTCHQPPGCACGAVPLFQGLMMVTRGDGATWTITQEEFDALLADTPAGDCPDPPYAGHGPFWEFD